MIILALDTTAITASVALLDSDKVIGVTSIHNKLTHSEKLLPMIDELLKNSGYNIDDVELIAVSKGPGSFTGVRIGIATAKGLAFSKRLDLVGVSALEALAENVRLNTHLLGEEIIISPSMDARRNELYNAFFSYDGVELMRMTPDRAISTEEVMEELKNCDKCLLINGDGAEKLYDYLIESGYKGRVTPASELQLKQNAVSVGRVAYKKYLSGVKEKVNEIAPLYLRTSQAERINNKEN